MMHRECMRDQGSSADFVRSHSSLSISDPRANRAGTGKSFTRNKEFQMRLNLSTVLSVSTVVAVAAPASAALTLTNFEITTSRISFNLSGTITAQQAGKNEIRIVDNADDFGTSKASRRGLRLTVSSIRTAVHRSRSVRRRFIASTPVALARAA